MRPKTLTVFLRIQILIKTFIYLFFLKLQPLQNGSFYAHRPLFIQHLPPLNEKKPAYSKKPKIIDRGALTLATPIKEEKNHRFISDTIGNNYSPNAKKLNAKVIYELTKAGELT